MQDYYIYHNEEGAAVRTETDLDLIESAPDQRRGALAWVFVKLQSKDEHGWCLEQECDLLYRMQRELSARLQEKLDGINSGTRMQDGWMEIYYYLPTAKGFDRVVREVLDTCPGYAHETGTAKDEKWEHYFHEICPDDLMLQQIQSRHIIQELELEGDDLEAKREVEHYLFFQTPAQRDRVVNAIAAEGFLLKESVETEGEYAYGAIVCKTHDVMESTLMGCTQSLLESARKEHGIYEGWSTTLAADV